MNREGTDLPPAKTLIERNESGETYQAIAQELGTTRGTIAGLIYREKQRIETHVQPEADDVEKWRIGLRSLPAQYRFAFVSDLHIPDHDAHAFELACKIVEAFKPDICPQGSDAFDFKTISRWDIDPAELSGDAWAGIDTLYTSLMSDMRSALPDNVLMPFLVGNHDERIHKFMTDKAPQFRQTITKMFVETVQKSGGLWLGMDAYSFDLNPLYVSHVGRSTPKSFGDRKGWSRWFLYGHFHKFQSVAKTTTDRVLTAQASGCLCNLSPSYKSGNEEEDWQHGITLVTVDQVAQTCHFEPVVFSRDYTAYWGGKRFEVKRKVYR